jgi:uncharacterized protein (DUF1697 family)
MPTFIALLRAVNLGPHNKVAMADLRGLLDDLGMEDPRTLLQTGNLVFRSDASKTEELERRLETEAKARLGLDTDVFVRTAEEWRKVAQGNPFPEEAESDPGHLLVFALKEAPGRAAVKALQEAIRGREVVRAKGRHAYVVYPDGIGRSRLTNAVIEKHLGTRGTGRNWNTVLKLQALATP